MSNTPLMFIMGGVLLIWFSPSMIVVRKPCLAFYPSASASYIVDASAIVAIVVYSIGFALVRGLLKLFTKERR